MKLDSRWSAKIASHSVGIVPFPVSAASLRRRYLALFFLFPVVIPLIGMFPFLCVARHFRIAIHALLGIFLFASEVVGDSIILRSTLETQIRKLCQHSTTKFICA
jgi:hypothetical protein